MNMPTPILSREEHLIICLNLSCSLSLLHSRSVIASDAPETECDVMYCGLRDLLDVPPPV
jgi:hypothetical protein